MWGGIAALGVLLLGLLFYVKACEEPIEGFSPATETELLAIAEEILGDELPEKDSMVFPTPRVYDVLLSESSQEALDTVLDERTFLPISGDSRTELRAMIQSEEGVGLADPTLNLRARMAIVRASAVGDDSQNLITYSVSASGVSSLALSATQSVDGWMQMQAARMIFLQAMSASLAHDGWTDEDKRDFVDKYSVPDHRAALGRVLRRRFIEQRIPEIAEASKAADMADLVANALLNDPTEDETKLIAGLLKRHPRAFGPEATASAGAESVRQIAVALEGSWVSSKTILDLVASGQSAWTDFLDVLDADQALAIVQIGQLKTQIDSLENPVGLALLHRGRTGWASLVQAAYVADAQEALFKIALLKKTGKDDEAAAVLDPLTGEPYDLDGGFARSKATEIGEPYSFIRAFAKAQYPL